MFSRRTPRHNRRFRDVARAFFWPPTQVSGCVAWVDCQETLTQAGTVTSIRNMVSGVDWTEATNPPTYAATGLNGRPCMIGNGSSMRIMSTEAAVVAACSGSDKAVTVFLVTEEPTPDAINVLFAAASSTVNTNSTLSFFTTTAGLGRWSVQRIDDAAGTVSAPRGVDIAAGPQIVSWVIPGTTASIYVGDEEQADPNAAAFDVGATTPTRVALLCRPDLTPDLFADAKIGALLLYSRALSDLERIGVVNGLRARWGL